MPGHEFPTIDLSRRVSNPPLKVWLWHFFWFFLTFVTTTITGTVPLFYIEYLLQDRLPPSQSWVGDFWQLSLIPSVYVQILGDIAVGVFSHPGVLLTGLMYSVPLLFILTCHEFGHYIACRIYDVDSTLPYFLPSPPLIAVGTFGAFIKIRSPLPSRRAVFDIGVAGPIAGFIALLPVAVLGVYYTQPMPAGAVTNIYLSDPLLLRLLAWLMNVDLASSVATLPFYSVAWIGLLVTSLNLIPAGQLDGGHAVYAIFGKSIHAIIARIAFVVMAMFSILGLIFFNSPGTILFVVILAIMLRVGHPEPYDDTPLDIKRRVVAALTLLIFILSFVPFPIQINLF